MSSDTGEVVYRVAQQSDAEGVARLHADSWRQNYRGAYSDTYLDGDVFTDRLAVWRSRIGHENDGTYTFVADAGGEVVGFAHTVLGDDPRWGALLDNLHVTNERKRSGIGTHLIAKSADWVRRSTSSSGMYLWVLEQNNAAQAFYRTQGGSSVESVVRGPFPGGGTAVGFRYSWPASSLAALADRLESCSPPAGAEGCGHGNKEVP